MNDLDYNQKRIHISRRDLLKVATAANVMTLTTAPLSAKAVAAAAPDLSQRRLCSRIPGTTMRLDGWIGSYFNGVSEQWLKVAPVSNPAMLEMFRDRDLEPKRELLPWSGEFAGKYLTSAVQVYRVTADDSLRKVIADFVARLATLQAADGYLGPFPSENALTGKSPNSGTDSTFKIILEAFNCKFPDRPPHRGTWDTWGHYHIMLGLLLWFEETHDATALQCARKMGDLLCNKFEHERLVDIGSTEMNLAPIHSLCLLYAHTREARYLNLAKKICAEFAATDSDGKPLAGDYLNGPLAGKEFYELPRPRWESLHPIMGLSELYALTGDEKAFQAFKSIWWSIVKGDRHNNGGFSSGEKACGNPYDKGPIETCCTIAWLALSVEMLRLTRNSVIADELELSTLNSVVGLHSPNGRWVTYNTPMDGVRKSSTHDISFQAREGSPELSCCSVNGARGFGMMSDWALMASEDGVILNWYGPGSMSARLRGLGNLALEQQTDYPRDNHVRLTVRPDAPARFALRLRIPYWSRKTQVQVNGKPVPNVQPARYLVLDRLWNPGDRIDMTFDFSLQYWVGEREYENKVSIYRGPVLLTYDRRFNTLDSGPLPALDARGLKGKVIQSDHWLPPLLLMEFKAADGRALRLCDFGSAGVGGSPYRSWLDVASCGKTEFSESNPRRSSPVV